MQPVINDAMSLRQHGRLHSAAAVVTADQHMLHIEKLDRVLQRREHAQVIRMGLIGDVAMGENFARLRSGEHLGRHP